MVGVVLGAHALAWATIGPTGGSPLARPHTPLHQSRRRVAVIPFAGVLLGLAIGTSIAQPASTSPQRTTSAAHDSVTTRHGLAMSAKAICSAVFIGGRDAADFIERDLRTDPAFDWWDDVQVDVDRVQRRVVLTRPGAPAPQPGSARQRPTRNGAISRTAVYHNNLGCTILPEGATGIFFAPVARAPRRRPPTTPWPLGDYMPEMPLPSGVDEEAMREALDFAFDDSDRAVPQNTRALVVVYRGSIVAERYAAGFDRESPLVGWSMGKSIASALVGYLVQLGHVELDQPAPVAAWQEHGDPRQAITIRNLLQMSSGLDFRRQSPAIKTRENDHFYVYYGAVDVAALAISRPLAHTPGTHWAYRNGDPLILGRIVREVAEAAGKNPLDWPHRALFDKLGIRSLVLEPDPYGNFILTGYDWGTARDWARFGLLHLQDGIWSGERILPEGWVDFVRTPAPAHPAKEYGGLFWLNAGGVLPHAPRDTYFAAGHLGQHTLIIPSADLVIVRLGHSPDSASFREYFDETLRRVLNAVRVEPD
jgi:CubicO group peptidase (beta-lactamase class C family)